MKPSPHWGIYTWPPLFPAAVSVTYWSVSFLNCSIFRIHNHSCMNVQFCFSQQTNHLLRPRMLTLFFVHWLICLLSLHSSFISNLKANISSLNITLLPHILSLSLSLFTLCPPPLSLLLSYPGIICQCNEGIIGAPFRWVGVTAVPSITTETWLIALGMEGGEYEWTDPSESERGWCWSYW